MQSLPIYLYENILAVTLDLDTTVRGVNQVMYQRDLQIQKGIKNVVRIQFKNSDQKRVPITDSSVFIFSMFDAINNRLLVEKQLAVLDDGSTLALKGLAELTLTESDTMDLPVSSYQFVIKRQDPTDGTYLPTYADTYYGVSGKLHLKQDAYPVLQPSQEIISFNRSYNSSTAKYEHKSGSVYAYPEFNGNQALHTMAIYMKKFKGTVYIQGTLSNIPGFNYSTISTKVYNGFSGIDYANFNGVYTYVRAYYVPATAPAESMNDNPAFYGSLDKILYRC
jgi:hypothetical protein